VYFCPRSRRDLAHDDVIHICYTWMLDKSIVLHHIILRLVSLKFSDLSVQGNTAHITKC